MSVFVDTNVLVHWRDARDLQRQARAAAWLRHLWHERSGRVSTQVLSEYYAVVTRKLAPSLARDDAWDDVQALTLWNPQPIDTRVLSRARAVEERHRLSWWDSLIVAAAQEQRCTILLTEDLQEGADYGGVVVRSPFTLDANEPEVAAATGCGGHPPRGRPRKGAASRL
ncbi:MAG: PIN domain-containing protein [Casimicrobiaceae bacterium]